MQDEHAPKKIDPTKLVLKLTTSSLAKVQYEAMLLSKTPEEIVFQYGDITAIKEYSATTDKIIKAEVKVTTPPKATETLEDEYYSHV